MTNESAPVARLNRFLAAVRIAHEAIYELHAELVARSAGEARRGELLAESARITLTEVPALTAQARQLAAAWHEQSLLDPARAEHTQRRLAAELEHLDRQREIARQLQEMG